MPTSLPAVGLKTRLSRAVTRLEHSPTYIRLRAALTISSDRPSGSGLAYAMGLTGNRPTITFSPIEPAQPTTVQMAAAGSPAVNRLAAKATPAPLPRHSSAISKTLKVIGVAAQAIITLSFPPMIGGIFSWSVNHPFFAVGFGVVVSLLPTVAYFALRSIFKSIKEPTPALVTITQAPQPAPPAAAPAAASIRPVQSKADGITQSNLKKALPFLKKQLSNDRVTVAITVILVVPSAILMLSPVHLVFSSIGFIGALGFMILSAYNQLQQPIRKEAAAARQAGFEFVPFRTARKTGIIKLDNQSRYIPTDPDNAFVSSQTRYPVGLSYNYAVIRRAEAALGSFDSPEQARERALTTSAGFPYMTRDEAIARRLIFKDPDNQRLSPIAYMTYVVHLTNYQRLPNLPQGNSTNFAVVPKNPKPTPPAKPAEPTVAKPTAKPPAQAPVPTPASAPAPAVAPAKPADQPVSPPPLSFTTLDGVSDTITLKERIGNGGEAEGFSATLGNGRVVFVKIARRDLPTERYAAAKRNLQSEVVYLQTAASAAPGRVVKIIGHNLETAQPFIVLESIPYSLKEPPAGGFTLEQKIGLFAELCDFIAALANQGENSMVHRDLSPDNIRLAFDADGSWHIKVADFGNAISLCMAGSSTDFRGKIPFLAPEVLAAGAWAEETAVASELWSAGQILHYMLTGRTIAEVKLNKPAGEITSEDVAHKIWETRDGTRVAIEFFFPDSLPRLPFEIENELKGLLAGLMRHDPDGQFARLSIQQAEAKAREILRKLQAPAASAADAVDHDYSGTGEHSIVKPLSAEDIGLLHHRATTTDKLREILTSIANLEKTLVKRPAKITDQLKADLVDVSLAKPELFTLCLRAYSKLFPGENFFAAFSNDDLTQALDMIFCGTIDIETASLDKVIEALIDFQAEGNLNEATQEKIVDVQDVLDSARR